MYFTGPIIIYGTSLQCFSVLSRCRNQNFGLAALLKPPVFYCFCCLGFIVISLTISMLALWEWLIRICCYLVVLLCIFFTCFGFFIGTVLNLFLFRLRKPLISQFFVADFISMYHILMHILDWVFLLWLSLSAWLELCLSVKLFICLPGFLRENLFYLGIFSVWFLCLHCIICCTSFPICWSGYFDLCRCPKIHFLLIGLIGRILAWFFEEMVLNFYCSKILHLSCQN